MYRFSVFLITAVLAQPALGAPGNTGARACGSTADAAFTACGHAQLDSYWTALGQCRNETDADARAECLQDAKDTLNEGRGECRAQRAARKDLCAELGQAPYDPSFDSASFLNPKDVGGSVAPNHFLPITPGRTLVYRSDTEEISVVYTGDIEVVNGVPCEVVRDTVTVDGVVTEDTIDWLAQDSEGNVWYCGEATAEYEDGIPVNTDGSFRAGTDGAKAGILMKANPQVGDVYRQEFDIGNAEDAAKVVSLTGSATVPAASCAGDCLITEETTALEPDALEHKYYAAGVGLILEVASGGGRTELVHISD